MKIKTSELIDPALDWAVATCEGGVGLWYDTIATYWIKINGKNRALSKGWAQSFTPSTAWTQGGPIIEREGITSVRVSDEYGRDERGFYNNVRIPVWAATSGQFGLEFSTEHQQHEGMFQILASDVVYGPTPLIAAMRCYLASKFGNEVEIPDELL